MSALLKVGVGAAVLVSSLTGLPGFEGAPLGASAAHAEHRDYRRHRRHHDGFDVGDAIVGAVVVGGLIAVLSSAKKKDDERDRPLEPRWDPRGDWDRDGDVSWQDRDWSNRTSEERAAISMCAREAEDLGSRYGREARVREIGDVDREGGEYRVKGYVDMRGDDTRRDDRTGGDTRESQEFICYVRNDRISDFRFLEGYAAR